MIEIKNLYKSFGTKQITKDLSINVSQGEFLVIIGRSGEGKSVLLKQIIGLIESDSGSISLDGKDLQEVKKIDRNYAFKRCGYVFQFAALLDSLTVLENVGINKINEGVLAEDIKDIVIEKLNEVGLDQDVLYKLPNELSGGMKKRVGLARTLMLSPEVLLYDEPTTGLDPITTKIIHELMLKTHKKLNATTIAISHDVEIFNYATHIAMLHEGKIIYKGSTEDVWSEENPYIKQFIRGHIEGPIK